MLSPEPASPSWPLSHGFRPRVSAVVLNAREGLRRPWGPGQAGDTLVTAPRQRRGSGWVLGSEALGEGPWDCGGRGGGAEGQGDFGIVSELELDWPGEEEEVEGGPRASWS